MSSNGIRFSISDLSSPAARILPTVYQDRAGVSLHDVQFQQGSDVRHPIPENVQNEVIAHLSRFRRTCLDLRVPDSNVAVLATEATRLAPNSTTFRDRIRSATGWDVQILSQDEEGSIGALGVASSLVNVEGLVMDLGGGSMQITWVDAKNAAMQMGARGSISLPYGAAELTRRLEQAKNAGQDAVRELEHEMLGKLQKAYHELGVPEDTSMVQGPSERGMNLYLSGGGFRGWGHLLMSKSKVNPYPIPTINGFKTDKRDFQDTASVAGILSATSSESNVFRISQRRASQVPAIAFLVNVVTPTLPSIKDIYFCQGGVREGYLFKSLPSEIRSQDPLLAATTPYRTSSSATLSSILQSAFPVTQEVEPGKSLTPPSFNSNFITAFSNIMHTHSGVPKDIRPAAALRCTTTGLLASAHGLSHEERVLLALSLYERWSGDLSSPDQKFLARLRQIVSMEEAWWCRYLGRVTAAVGEAYPAGVVPVDEKDLRITFNARLESKVRPKKGGVKRIVRLVVGIDDSEFIRGAAQQIEKLGKKKNWIKAEDRAENTEEGDWGLKVDVEIETRR